MGFVMSVSSALLMIRILHQTCNFSSVKINVCYLRGYKVVVDFKLKFGKEK